MKVSSKKATDLERVEWTHDLFKYPTDKIPCENNCPYMVVTDTLNCRKDSEGVVDMEEVRDTSEIQVNVRFGHTEGWSLIERVRNIRSSWQVL
jgi:hypothetical protein